MAMHSSRPFLHHKFFFLGLKYFVLFQRCGLGEVYQKPGHQPFQPRLLWSRANLWNIGTKLAGPLFRKHFEPVKCKDIIRSQWSGSQSYMILYTSIAHSWLSDEVTQFGIYFISRKACICVDLKRLIRREKRYQSKIPLSLSHLQAFMTWAIIGDAKMPFGSHHLPISVPI